MDYSKFLVLHINNYFSDDMRELGIKVRWIHKNDHCSIRKWNIAKLLGLEKSLLGFTRDDVIKAEYILICNHMYIPNKIGIIHEWNPLCKIVWFLWDAADDVTLKYIQEIKCMRNVKIYSYDKRDSEKYNILWHNSATKKYATNNFNITENVWDFGCVMLDRGRIPVLKKIQEFIESSGFSYKFIVKKEKHKKYDIYSNIEFINDSMPYSDVIKYDLMFKCIVDILFEKNTGLSLRAYESIFYNKKLLTTNEDIRNYDFYNPNNIFILTDYNMHEISEFMRKPYVKIAEEIQKKYQYEYWLEDLFKGEFI